jgi:uncharacterized protein (TIGR03437 family)
MSRASQLPHRRRLKRHAWNKTVHQQTTPGTPGEWSLNIPADGSYTLQAWLPAAPASSAWTTNAIYEVVSGGVTIATYTLDQTTAAAGDGWHNLGTVNLTAAGAPFLRVHNGGSALIVADAIYVSSSSALFNDGSAATQITLGPFDGILLQRSTPAAAPASHINSVVNAAGYQPAIASNTFISILGTGFTSGNSRTWTSADFNGNNLPTSLDGISVTINGIPAYVEYIGPTQINALAPADSTIGPVQIVVETPQGPSYSGTVLKQLFAPAFFTYSIANQTYAAALHSDGTLVGAAGENSRPAVPGEIVEIYGCGFGATNAAIPIGQLVSQPAPLAAQPTVRIGGMNATVSYAGLVASGLYQINVVVPGLAAGDKAVQADVAGFQSPSGIYLSIGGGNQAIATHPPVTPQIH